MPPVSHPVSARIATAIIPDESVTKPLDHFRLASRLAQSQAGREEEMQL